MAGRELRKEETDTVGGDQNSLGAIRGSRSTTANHTSSTTSPKPLTSSTKQHPNLKIPLPKNRINPRSGSTHCTPSKWAGYPGHPATTQPPPKPRTAAALPPTDQVVHGAGKVGISSSHVWIGTRFWMRSKMTRKRGGSARRRWRSLRLLVRRLGYVYSFVHCLVW